VRCEEIATAYQAASHQPRQAKKRGFVARSGA
jgi:hypothetical protein